MTCLHSGWKILHMSDDALLTTGQIAERLAVDRTTVHYWIRTGKLSPTQTVSGVRYFDPETVARFANARALLKGGAKS